MLDRLFSFLRMRKARTSLGKRFFSMRGERIEIFMHPNNLVESYAVLSRISRENPELLARKVEPSAVIHSAYATFNVVYDEETALKLGALKLKYEDKPW